MKRSTVLFAFAGSALVPGFAAAQGSSMTGPDAAWYAGLSVGQSKGKCADGLGAMSCDDTDTAWKVLGGYQFNRHFGAELGYQELGKINATLPAGMASVKTNVWDLVAVGTLPIADKFAAFGKLGAYRADSKLSSDALGDGSENKSGGTYGVGVQYDINRSVGVRGEWQRYAKVGGDNVGGEQDIDVYGVAVVYRFE